MAWWYLANAQQIGPLSEAAFAEHVGRGAITAHTLVWCEEMTNWEPLGNLVTGEAGGPGRAAAAAAMQGRGLCCQCGKAFEPDDLIEYSGYKVCSACKPAFFQRLSEGMLHAAPAAGGIEYGGFWLRFAAKLIDVLILSVVNVIFAIPLMVFMMSEAADPGDPQEFLITQLVLQAIMTLIQWAIQCAYVTFFLGKYAATPGKMACGLKVIRSDGAKITYLRGFGRFWAELLSGLTLYIGYIIAAFDEQKRTLHDHICNTRVVRK
jgi:uncharacterized RDD family membrane protein YckC